ncbi:MAG: hypothetical protein ACN6RH_15745 [Stenotrophomonas rhizophila]|uniref:hypothetical protein n=1 Tax=Stenotrophomonas rhizophila TaxID=216778 RepID=UPI003D0ACE0C
MPSIFRLLTAALLAAAIAACGPTKPETEPMQCAVAPEAVVVERRVYVPIPAALTRSEAVPEGPIAQCFDVAAQRRAVIERLNGRAEQVRAIQSTEVKP